MPLYQPGPLPLGGYQSLFDVVRYDREASGDDRFKSLPNVRVLSYHLQEGLYPSAQFEYVLDDTDTSSPFPYAFEELWPIDAEGDYVVKQDDEVLVFEYLEGDRILVFHGFVDMPQVNMGQGLSTTFAAQGVAVRLDDFPIQDAVYRDAGDPAGTSATYTDQPVWFNPSVKGRAMPNATPSGYNRDAGEPNSRPIFLDWRLTTAPGSTPVTPAFWTLAGFVRHLCWEYNPDETYVKNPVTATGVSLDDYLVAVTPVDGNYMDFDDPATYTVSDITVRSFDCTGKTLREALTEQLGYYGFHIHFNLREDPDDPGAPVNEMILFRTDGRDGNAPKDLFYPAKGGRIDLEFPDLHEVAMVRDGVNSPNEYEIETGEVEYEVSVVLAPGFSPASGDAGSVSDFDYSKLAFASAELRRKYRRYVFDECGTGHWDFGTSAWVTTATSLDDVLGAPEDGERQYARRFRPGSNTVLAVDSEGKYRKAELAISRDYAGPCPGVWDRTGTWRSMGRSGWQMSDDELGVTVTADNPETWAIPKSADGTAPGDTVRGVTSIANPGGVNTRFYLRLTTVIKGDWGIDAFAGKRQASPRKFAVRRLIESRDHWKKQVAHKSSAFNSTGATAVVRDDTDKARAHAEALRIGTEFPSVAGSISVPWVSHAVGVGDNLSGLTGVDLTFQGNAGIPAGETPRYPTVVGVSYNCVTPQTTTYKLADRRAEEIEDANHGYGRSR